MMNDFSDKTVLLTGALGTLGRAQAELFAQSGASIVLLDRLETAEGEAFAASLRQETGGKFVYQRLDINRLDTIEAAVQAMDPIDILINNAALIINKPFEEFSITEYEDQVRVNSSAAFALSRAVAPNMKEQCNGAIINFCSLTLNGRWEGYVPYVASKGAMFGLTKSLARELGPFGVRVNAVSPGAVVSDAERRVFGDRLEEYHNWVIENQSLKSRIEPEHIADLVLFLCSSRAAMITGQNFNVDGGW
jgi:NAD(P)-dependent dehydrogenase (short-subunit alcohol dehydrogenase family)